MRVAYDGTRYYGFQTQPGGNTIQDEIEKGIETLTGEKVKITASGRTDAKVHALAQVFNFHTDSQIAVSRWALALNSRLPDDIRIVGSAVEVPLDFHSRRSAKRKTYRYSIDTGKFHDVFQRFYQFHHPAPALRVELMRSALQHLLGEHDFTSFTSVRSDKTSHIRTIYEAELVEEANSLHLYLTGNGFLYNMVRIIAGTLIQIGEGKRPPEGMRLILEARNRAKAGPTAMPHGLTLIKVDYGDEPSGLTF